MKEENKKTKTTKKASTTAKKTTAKKAATAKKTSPKKSVTLKKEETKVAPKKSVNQKKATAPKKETTKVVAKKTTTTTAKKVAPKKVVKKPVVKQENIKVEETIKEPVIEKKEVKVNNNDVILKTVVSVAFTLIVVMFMIGLFGNNLNFINLGNNTSYLIKNEKVDKYNVFELKDAKDKIAKLHGNYFIYISFKNKDTSNFEKKLAKIIDSYNLKSKFYYIDVDSVVDDSNYIDTINKTLGFENILIEDVPTLIYVNKDNIMRRENVLSKGNNKTIQINEFEKLLDLNGFNKK